MRSRDGEQEDYLIRMIKQAADALRLLRHRLMGTANTAEGVRAGAEAAIGALLGPRASLIEKLDATSAVQLVGHPDLVDLWAALLEVEADAASREGDDAGTLALRKRVGELRDATVSIWGPPRN